MASIEPALMLEGLTKAFGGVTAVNEVSLSVVQGTLTTLVGPNGAGKSTVFAMVSGFIRPDKGRVLLEGVDVTGLAAQAVSRAGVGRLFQEVRVFGRMSTLDNVLVAFADQPGENPLSGIVRPSRSASVERLNITRALDLLRDVSLNDRWETTADRLSFGQQKLLAIARLLANDARLILLDEPAAGVSLRLKPVLIRMIRALVTSRRTVVMIEHDLGMVRQLSDTVHLMHRGCIVSSGAPDEIVRGDPWRQIYGGIE